MAESTAAAAALVLQPSGLRQPPSSSVSKVPLFELPDAGTPMGAAGLGPLECSWMCERS